MLLLMSARRRLPIVCFLTLIAACSFGAKRSSVVTYSRSDLSRIVGEGCGPSSSSSRNAVHAHRNADASMLYLISEDARELIVLPESQQCNKLSANVVDLWRDDKGQAVALLYERQGERLLVIGQSELRGKRFDIERSGRYLLIFNGASSIVNSMERPYLTMLKLNVHAQRIFARKRELLVVGDNPETKMLEARVVGVGKGVLSEQAPIAINNMPAGIRVLDYSEASDELLLGGVDASGQASFVIYNLTTGQSSGVAAQKPGDDQAMFVPDSKLRARLSGASGPAQVEETAKPKKEGGLLNKLKLK